MAYSDFTMSDLENQFGIRHERRRMQFDIQRIEPSTSLKEDLEFAEGLLLNSEKARSEWIVVPLLKELMTVNDKYFTVHSGENLNADIDKGLKGECDFILAKNLHTVNINYPIIQIVEAKKHDVELGIEQCAAQIVGAYYFNKNKGLDIRKIYGCVTNGKNWLFMKLENDLICIDQKNYYLGNLPELLGTFQAIIDYYKRTLN